MDESPIIGTRLHVIGNSGSGKSTVAAGLSEILDVPFVELDALNWEPGWVGLNEKDPVEFERRIEDATRGDAWVVAGSYSRFSKKIFWGRVQTVIWLDLPISELLIRTLKRSWKRWRSKELLWGTNYESFWRQLMVWRKDDSLVWWIVTQQERKRRDMQATMSDPRWSHIQFIRLTTPLEVSAFVGQVVAWHSQSRPA